MALDTITLHGQILAPVTGTPAVGTVTFKILDELRDNADNIIYAPMTFVAVLDANGEFTIDLPVTDNPVVTPLDWSYWVYVDTDIWVSGVFYIQLPSTLGPVAEFADILELFPVGSSCTPDGTACAPIGALGALQEQIDELAEIVGGIEINIETIEADIEVLQGQVLALQADLDAVEADVDAIEAELVTITGDIATLQGQVATLQGQMTTALADINSLQITQGALVTTVNIHTGQIATLQGQMTTALTDIATLQGQMTTVQGQIVTLQGQVATIQGNAGLVGPTTFVNVAIVAANLTLGTVPAATRLERGADATRIRGFLTATGAVGAGVVLANIGTVAHRPLVNKSMGVRYSGGSTRLQVLTNGDITIAAALVLNDQVWLDSTTYDLVA